MTLELSGKLGGNIAIQPSKSAAHRALICAALAKGNSVVENIALSKDIEATAGCLTELGVCDMNFFANTAHVSGGKSAKSGVTLDCGESGSTYRFMLPIAAALSDSAKFIGAPRLFERPITPLTDALAEHGAMFADASISGRINCGKYSIAGNVSSQYISGLLFALPLLDGKSEIHLSTPLESSGYVDMTMAMQKKFGIKSTFKEGIYSVTHGKYTPKDVTVEGDWSHAAFFAVAGAIGKGVTISGLERNSLQGDRAIADILQRMGAKIKFSGDLTVYPSKLTGIDIDAAQIPDLVPVLAVAGCAAQGVTRIYNAQRLRIKESDRLSTICEALTALGADIEVTEEGLLIRGSELTGGSASAAGDHRIAMSVAVAAGLCKHRVTLEGAEHVSKSAPAFWEEFSQLGGIIHE